MLRPLALLTVALTSTACLPRNTISDRARALNDLCAQQLSAGQLDDAEISCTHSLEFNDTYADAWNNLGLIDRRRGNADASRLKFIKAVRLEQDHAQAYTNLGVDSLERGKLVEA